MARTRSTAALESCYRTTKVFEPFNPYNLFNIPAYNKNLSKLEQIEEMLKIRNNVFSLYQTYIKKVNKEQLNLLFNKLNEFSTVSKVIASDLEHFLPGRKWFYDADHNQTHEIIVLVRNRRDTLYSQLLADYFGYFKNVEVEPYNIIVKEDDFVKLRTSLDNFLRFFPTNYKIYDFYNLPKDLFNINAISIQEQVTFKKLKYIKNLEFCEEQIQNLIEYYDELWKEKIKDEKY